MNKEESLSFLQSRTDKVNLAPTQDIQFYREMYNKDCATSITESNKGESEVVKALDKIKAKVEQAIKVYDNALSNFGKLVLTGLERKDKK